MFSLKNLSPEQGSSRNAVNTVIELTIDNPDNNIDMSSIIVTICGQIALQGLIFSPNFNSEYSTITFDGTDIVIAIKQNYDFKLASIVDVKVQARDLQGKYSTESYFFKIITDKPYLFDFSPKEKVISPQKMFLRIKDDSFDLNKQSLSVSINSVVVISGGEYMAPFRGTDSIIVENSSSDFSITIDPEEFLRDGIYRLFYSISNSNQKTLSSSFSFDVKYTEQILPDNFPQARFLGFFQGIKEARDMGDGKNIYLSWGKPISRIYSTDVYVLIYRSNDRLKIFDSTPLLISKSENLETLVTGTEVGVGHYFAARAMETYADIINVDGMNIHSENIFYFPNNTELSHDLLPTDTVIRVTSTAGYPVDGLLNLSGEVIRYVGKTDTTFLTSLNMRGLSGSQRVFHESKEVVKFFTSCQDDNTVISYVTSAHQNLDPSGMQVFGTGLIVPDFSEYEKIEHDGLDHCGYHQALPWLTLSNKDSCGSYLGGENNGFRGMDIHQMAMDREEELFEVVADKCVLLKKLWDGAVCSCVTLRRGNPKVRTCKLCYGVGIVGGYEQLLNSRRIDKRVLVRFYEAQEDIKKHENQYFAQDFQPSATALFKPVIKDSDIIIRFNLDGQIEFIYEVLNSSRERFVFNKYGRQKLNLVRLDKTDVLYQFPFIK